MKKNLEEQKKPCRENGFSLMEVIIAIAILSIGLLSVGAMQSAAMKGNASSMSINEATMRASNKLETLLTLPQTDSDVADTDLDGKAGLGNVGVGISDHFLVEGRYELFWNIAVGDINPNTRTVSVFVRWMDRGDEPRHVIVQGVIRNR